MHKQVLQKYRHLQSYQGMQNDIFNTCNQDTASRLKNTIPAYKPALNTTCSYPMYTKTITPQAMKNAFVNPPLNCIEIKIPILIKKLQKIPFVKYSTKSNRLSFSELRQLRLVSFLVS